MRFKHQTVVCFQSTKFQIYITLVRVVVKLSYLRVRGHCLFYRSEQSYAFDMALQAARIVERILAG
ncbi:hypothetical protein SPFM10_00185 [Salmonella phage SPFM10]|nr:hypothetical protein SPFM6_00192 [Salmonella phage SPFM6]VFR12554.1 hypothetical protein SPFM10_00185 [Salmonella phage SPFM10]